MKELHGRAVSVVAVPVQECFDLLAAADRYPSWLDAVREVEVLEREQGGRPARVWAKLHVAQSPIKQDFELALQVRTEGHQTVRLTRLGQDASDRDQLELRWSLQGDGDTRIEFEFEATVSFLPRLLPLGGIGDRIATHVLRSATATLTAATS